jgi:hypothetical protein
LVEGVHEDEQGQLEYKASRGYGVQVFRKAGGELAESCFYAFAEMLK